MLVVVQIFEMRLPDASRCLAGVPPYDQYVPCSFCRAEIPARRSGRGREERAVQRTPPRGSFTDSF